MANLFRALEYVLQWEGGYSNDPVAILNEIQNAMDQMRFSVQRDDISRRNLRDYMCRQDNCIRMAYASGYCNVHYIRMRKGRNMAAPIRAKKKNDTCSLCGGKTDAHGGWGLCKQHYRAKRVDIIKNACIKAMGGACVVCGDKYPREVYDFHHVNPDEKEASPSVIIANNSPERIAEELSKCVLMCANCHRVEHSNG